eukprot:6212728-Pleurochrysis_carterae.AAC.1
MAVQAVFSVCVPNAILADGGQETASSASRYKYRTSVQANLWMSTLLRYSLVPPCLQTGANFGLTSFFASLVRIEELGKLGDTIYRQTDGGSDNDAIITQVFHWFLVHMGVVNKVVWIRLKSKHSHNFADRTFSMIQAKLWGKNGKGGKGCASPWDFAQIVDEALRTQLGATESAWLWANFNWDEWAKSFSCVSSEFGSISSMRYWEYNYDLKVPEHGYVRVQFRESVLPAGEGLPDLLPAKQVDGVLVPKEEGLLFMKKGSFPTVDRAAPIEHWKAAEDITADAEADDHQRN